MKNPFLENFRPYIPAAVTHLRELTPFPLLVGTLLGIIFGASSLYLVLKTGLTVSASIPVAVIAITLFRLLSKMGARDATILEANVKLSEDDWVMGEQGKSELVRSTDASDIQDRYYRDYADHWRKFITSTHVKEYKNKDEATAALLSFSSANSPFASSVSAAIVK